MQFISWIIAFVLVVTAVPALAIWVVNNLFGENIVVGKFTRYII